MDHRPSEELLESTHSFPGPYKIKVIGNVSDDFESRVLEVVRAEVTPSTEVEYSIRSTPGGRHVSLTLDLTVESAEQVRSIYGRIRQIKGLVMLL
jgi:putative lipoic acid-binding regulatory protein